MTLSGVVPNASNPPIKGSIDKRPISPFHQSVSHPSLCANFHLMSCGLTPFADGKSLYFLSKSLSRKICFVFIHSYRPSLLAQDDVSAIITRSYLLPIFTQNPFASARKRVFPYYKEVACVICVSI